MFRVVGGLPLDLDRFKRFGFGKDLFNVIDVSAKVVCLIQGPESLSTPLMADYSTRLLADYASTMITNTDIDI